MRRNGVQRSATKGKGEHTSTSTYFARGGLIGAGLIQFCVCGLDFVRRLSHVQLDVVYHLTCTHMHLNYSSEMPTETKLESSQIIESKVNALLSTFQLYCILCSTFIIHIFLLLNSRPVRRWHLDDLDGSSPVPCVSTSCATSTKRSWSSMMERSSFKISACRDSTSRSCCFASSTDLICCTHNDKYLFR